MTQKTIANIEEIISDNLVEAHDEANCYNKRYEKLLDYYKRPKFKVVLEEHEEEEEDDDDDE